MRPLLVLAVFARVAHADDIAVGASVGAGAQGAATYDALEMRLDATWTGVRIGLGVRGVWDDGVFRRSDWSGIGDAVTIMRDVEAVHDVGEDGRVAIAAGRLAPAHVGQLVDGYRTSIDDRWRTGVRGAASTPDVEVGVEIDDVLDPALVAGAVRWQIAAPFALNAALAVDPGGRSESGPLQLGPGSHDATAFELGGSRRYESRTARLDVGLAMVAEVGLGVSGVAFANAALDRDGTRWTMRGDLRAGTGTVGSMFGPLYRIERLAHDGMLSLWDRARMGQLDGASAGGSIGASKSEGWLELGVRERPGLGVLGTIGGGLPMSRRIQAGVWGAAGPHDGAGAAEVRVAWAKRLFSALQAARIYQLDLMMPAAVWSVTAWFGATSD